ncbi:MAG: serine hydrolase domain-containing protein, partial [bacterium]
AAFLGALAPAVAFGQAPTVAACTADSTVLAAARRTNDYLDVLARHHELSAVVLVARGDCVLIERAFGLARLAPRTPNTPATRFAVASITKPLTVLVLDRLIRDGRLTLSDPIARWLPTFPRGDEITVGELRDHRAGIPHRVTAPADEYRPHVAADLVALAAHQSLVAAPGTKTAYSTAGYAILARVLELASGRPYAVLLESLVFRPAKASGAADATSGSIFPSPARSYVRVPGGFMSTRPQDLSYLVGGGSVYATSRDLFRIIRTLVVGGYSQTSRDSALRNGRLDWTGITDGYIAAAGYDSATELTTVTTANVYTGAIVHLHDDLLRLAAGEPIPPPTMPVIRAVRLSPAQQHRITGQYETRPGETAVLAFMTPSLALFGGAHLIVTSDTTFGSLESYDATVGVEHDAAGLITALRWTDQSRVTRYPRVAPKKPE